MKCNIASVIKKVLHLLKTSYLTTFMFWILVKGTYICIYIYIWIRFRIFCDFSTLDTTDLFSAHLIPWLLMAWHRKEVFIHKNWFENVVYKMSAILLKPQYFRLLGPETSCRFLQEPCYCIFHVDSLVPELFYKDTPNFSLKIFCH